MISLSLIKWSVSSQQNINEIDIEKLLVMIQYWENIDALLHCCCPAGVWENVDWMLILREHCPRHSFASRIIVPRLRELSVCICPAHLQQWANKGPQVWWILYLLLPATASCCLQHFCKLRPFIVSPTWTSHQLAKVHRRNRDYNINVLLMHVAHQY